MPQLARRAKKDLDELPRPLSKKAREIIRRLDQEPGPGKKLVGLLQASVPHGSAELTESSTR